MSDSTSNFNRSASGVLADLAFAGYDVSSVAALRVSGKQYKGAIPILIDWLRRAESLSVKEEIARALSVPWARPMAARPLIGEFLMIDNQTPGASSLRWALGNALEITGDDSVFDDMAAIVLNREFGTSRQMVVLGLGRSKRPEAVDILVSLLDDLEVNGHAAKALGKLTSSRARSGLENLLGDRRAWVRKEAAKALARIE